MTKDNEQPGNATERIEEASTDRRRMLTLLGLAATAAYVAPTLLSMDQAHASGGSGRGGGSGGGRGSGGGGRGRGSGGGGRGRGSGGSGRRGPGFGGRASRGSGRGRAGRGNGGPVRTLNNAFDKIFR